MRRSTKAVFPSDCPTDPTLSRDDPRCRPPLSSKKPPTSSSPRVSPSLSFPPRLVEGVPSLGPAARPPPSLSSSSLSSSQPSSSSRARVLARLPPQEAPRGFSRVPSTDPTSTPLSTGVKRARASDAPAARNRTFRQRLDDAGARLTATNEETTRLLSTPSPRRAFSPSSSSRRRARIRPVGSQLRRRVDFFESLADEAVTRMEEGIQARRGYSRVNTSSQAADVEMGLVSSPPSPPPSAPETPVRARRLPTFRGSSVPDALRVSGAGAGAGLLVSVGLSHLLPQTQESAFANAALSGAAGDTAARMAARIGQRAAGRAAVSIGRGIAEGGALGVVSFAADQALNSWLVSQGANHSISNIVSSSVVGVATAGISTAILASSVAAAPETLGLSLLVGGLFTLGSAIYGGVTGAQEDREEQTRRRNMQTYAFNRENLLRTLPRFDYDLDRALRAFRNRPGLGEDDPSWATFTDSIRRTFSDSPSAHPPANLQDESLTPEQRRVQQLYDKHIRHSVFSAVCDGASCQGDPGALTSDEEEFLNEQTQSTWRSQASVQVQFGIQQLRYNRQRVESAQQAILDAWQTENKLPEDLEPRLVETANLDPSFHDRFQAHIQADAQRRVIDAFYDSQTRIDDLPPNIRDTALSDPHFGTLINSYYQDIDSTAARLGISTRQVQELQSLSQEEAATRYASIQFQRATQDDEQVENARRLSRTQRAMERRGFYDIDAARLHQDPTSMESWTPADSQIIQAHASGLTLRQYNDYMRALARGEAGDYSQLPQYTEDQLTTFGRLDYQHLQDELEAAGYRRDIWRYDEATRQFTLNESVPPEQRNRIRQPTAREDQSEQVASTQSVPPASGEATSSEAEQAPPPPPV